MSILSPEKCPEFLVKIHGDLDEGRRLEFWKLKIQDDWNFSFFFSEDADIFKMSYRRA